MKKAAVLFLLMVSLFALAACGKQVKTPDDPNNGVIDPEPQDEIVEVTLYYMNQEYIMTGNEELEKLISIKKEVAIGEKPIEEVVIAELQKKPEDDKLSSSLEGLKVLSVETAENTAYVNFSSDKLSGGSLQEMGVIAQVVMSLTELPGIEQVQFLVDGSVRESLMGHAIIQEPIGREDTSFQ